MSDDNSIEKYIALGLEILMIVGLVLVCFYDRSQKNKRQAKLMDFSLSGASQVRTSDMTGRFRVK